MINLCAVAYPIAHPIVAYAIAHSIAYEKTNIYLYILTGYNYIIILILIYTNKQILRDTELASKKGFSKKVKALGSRRALFSLRLRVNE